MNSATTIPLYTIITLVYTTTCTVHHTHTTSHLYDTSEGSCYQTLLLDGQGHGQNSVHLIKLNISYVINNTYVVITREGQIKAMLWQSIGGKTTEVARLPQYKYYMKVACSTLIATDDVAPWLWNVERLGLWISLQAGTDNQLNRRSANAKFKKSLLSWVRTYYQKRWPRIRLTQTVKYVSSNPIQLSTSCKNQLCLKGILYKYRWLHFTWVRWGRLSSLAWTVFASEITRSPQKSIAPWHEWSLKKKSSSHKRINF